LIPKHFAKLSFFTCLKPTKHANTLTQATWKV